MTVRELIAELAEWPQDLPVMIRNDEGVRRHVAESVWHDARHVMQGESVPHYEKDCPYCERWGVEVQRVVCID